MRRLLIGGSPFQGRYPASEVNDGPCPEKPDHLTRADLDAALSLAQKLCRKIAASRFSPVGQVTASFGVAERRPREDKDAWLRRVDAALYTAKGAGRNGVHRA